MSFNVGPVQVTLSNLATVGRKCRAVREPTRQRNQNRDIAFVRMAREGSRTETRAIRDGQLRHYRAAYLYAHLEYVLGADGKKVKVSRRRPA